MDPQLKAQILKTRLIVFDFDGVFTDNAVWVMQDGTELVRCWRSDGLGLRLLEGLGIALLVLSTEENPVVLHRCRKLKIRCVHGCADKPAALDDLASELRVPLSSVAYLGNDINDYGCLERVGLPMVVQDAHSCVVPLARFQTESRGGYGAVREVCDLFHSIWTSKRSRRHRLPANPRKTASRVRAS